MGEPVKTDRKMSINERKKSINERENEHNRAEKEGVAWALGATEPFNRFFQKIFSHFPPGSGSEKKEIPFSR